MQLPAAQAPEPERPPAPAAGAAKPCPFCRQPVQAAAVRCRHCGRALGALGRRAELAGGQLVASYQSGMRGLSVSLILIGAITTLFGGFQVWFLYRLTRALGPAPDAMVFFFLGMYIAVATVGGLYMLFGYFAWKLRNWVNWLVAIVSGLSLALDALGVVMGGIDIISVIQMVIVVAFFATAVVNIRKCSRIRAAGLDPRAPTGAAIRVTGRSRTARPAAPAAPRTSPRVRR
jgi:hypothetical protein